MRRPIGVILLSAVFVLVGVEALWEGGDGLLRPSGEPLLLSCLQLAGGALALLTAVGGWRRAVWAWWAALLYGAVAAAMLLLLPSLLGLSPDESAGLPVGAAAVLAFAVLSAWYLRRHAQVVV